MATQQQPDNVDVSSDEKQDKHSAPAYRRWPYETQREERRVSPEPKPLSQQHDWSEPDDRIPEPTHNKQRENEAQGDFFDHHRSRSTAATRFNPEEASNTEQFELFKSWNDGCRDSDRQSVECEQDKYMWIDSWGHRLELPRCVIQEAKVLVADYGDLRRLGAYNGIHNAVLACLVEAYKRFWHLQWYRESSHDDLEHWYDRDDFRQLWSSIGLAQSDLRTVAKEISRGTAV